MNTLQFTDQTALALRTDAGTDDHDACSALILGIWHSPAVVCRPSDRWQDQSISLNENTEGTLGRAAMVRAFQADHSVVASQDMIGFWICECNRHISSFA